MTTPSQEDLFKLVFFAPPISLLGIKVAVFATGAGSYRNYSECCFTTPGVGQFKPGVNARPAIGKAGGELEKLVEVKCELLCVGPEVTAKAVEALKKYVCNSSI